MAISNSVPLSALKKIVGLLGFRGIGVQRMHLDHIELGTDAKGSPTTDAVTMIRLLVTPPSSAGAAGGESSWLPSLTRDVKRLKWVDDPTLALAYRTIPGTATGGSVDRQEVGIPRAEVVTCLSTILHALLSKQDVWAFSKTNINAVVAQPRYLRHAVGIADLFLARFDPKR